MDSRYDTFLTLCRLMSYRKTADAMHLTQPAVTQQIHSLEQEFGSKLFLYDHRTLTRTSASHTLESYIISLRYNYERLHEDMQKKDVNVLRIGATKTIGEFVIADPLKTFLKDPSHTISVEIDNTETLLKKLQNSELDFVLIEGIFDKSEYSSRLLRVEDFTGICSSRHPFAGKTVQFKDLFGETLIVREPGSGTRDILERELIQKGYSFKMFQRCSEISSFSLINQFVASNLGISFVYQSVRKQEKNISTFRVKGFEVSHEFNIVWLKHTAISETGEQFIRTLLKK